MDRGIELHRSRRHEIREVEPGVYRVPSCSGGGFYRVNLERETCECPDRAPVCKHQFAATIFAAKRRCRRASARPGQAPERRHSQPREDQRDDQERAGGNRRDHGRPSDTPGRGAVGFGYGVGKATVLQRLERMGS